jgi:hypothetical protein
MFMSVFLVIVIGGAIQFISTLILMVQIYNNYWTSYGRHILATISLLVTFTLSVVIATLASRITIRREYYTAAKLRWSKNNII